jgi:hypothetical protein
MSNEKRRENNAEMVAALVDALIASRDDRKSGAFYALGYLESMIAQNMTPALRKAIRARLDAIPGDTI